MLPGPRSAPGGTGRDGTGVGRPAGPLRRRGFPGGGRCAGAEPTRSGVRERRAPPRGRRRRREGSGSPVGGWRGGNREAPALGVRVAEQGGSGLGAVGFGLVWGLLGLVFF